MNKICKSVWSGLGNTRGAAGGITKGDRRNFSVSKKKKILTTAVLMAMMGCFLTGGLTHALTPDGQGGREEVQGKLNEGENTQSDDTKAGWILAVERGDDSGTGYEATAEGENAEVNSGDKVTLKAGRGIRLKQEGKSIRFELKFINVKPSSDYTEEAKSSGDGSVAVGASSEAGNKGTAIGSGARTKLSGVALGLGTYAGNSALALGSQAQAGGQDTIAIGRKVQINEKNTRDSIAIGHEASIDENGYDSVVIGHKTNINRANGGSIFGSNSEIRTSNNATAIGKLANVLYGSSGGTALGYKSVVTGAKGAVALGSESLANGSGTFGYAPDSYEWDNDKYKVAEYAGNPDQYKEGLAELRRARTSDAKEKAQWKINKSYNTWLPTSGVVSIGNEEKGITRQIIGLAAGTKDTDAVNVAQLKVVNAKIDKSTADIKSIENRIKTIENNTGRKSEEGKIKVEGDKETGIKADSVEGGDIITGYKISLDKKIKAGNVTVDGTDDKGEIIGLTNTRIDGSDFATKGRAATEEQLKKVMEKTQAQSRTTVRAGKNITITPGPEGTSEYTVALAEKISLNSVTAEEYKVGDKTYISKDGIDANGNKITNVGDGNISKDSNDAVNGKQLYSMGQSIKDNTENMINLGNSVADIGNKVGEMEGRINKAGAAATALAALHPLDFDPDNKWDFSAGYGHYKGANAISVGAFYRPDENRMISIGGSFGGGENMVNAGFSVKVGQGTGGITSKTVMAKEIREMKLQNEKMQEENRKLVKDVTALQKDNEELKKELQEIKRLLKK